MPPKTTRYLRAFEQIRDALAPALTCAGLQCDVSYRLNSASLSLAKPTWHNPAGARIFFCIWIPDHPKVPHRLSYSIHALQTWRMKIQSGTFAKALRKELSANLTPWPNISLDYGPANIMEGHIDVPGPASGDMDRVTGLVKAFIPVAPVIDRLIE